MKLETSQQIENMKKQTIGVEVEMNNISREKAARKVAEYFGTTAWNAASTYGYCSWACKDRQGRIWKFQKDCSIHGPEDEKCEMVTPILTYEDMDALANIMASHESLLAEALKLDRQRIYSYCRTVNPAFLKEVNKKKPKTMAAFADVWYKSQGENYGRDQHYNGSRYHMLNYHATFTKGTIEFRLFQFDTPENGKQNGLHAGQLKSYIQLCLALSELAKEMRSASSKPQQHENPKYAMRTWLLRLGFIGDEFKTARDLYTKRLSGDGACRRGRVA